MKVVMIRIAVALVCLTGLFGEGSLLAKQVKSPDGRIDLTLLSVDVEGFDHQTFAYSVAYDGKPLVAASRLRFRLDVPDGEKTKTIDFGDQLEILSIQNTQHDETWKPVYGERSLVRDHYQQLEVQLRDREHDGLSLTVTFRVFDAGVAFRMSLTGEANGPIQIAEELTEFTFVSDHTAWVTRKAQGIYEELKISTMGEEVERPLTLCADVDAEQPVYVAIAEAGLVDYARMKLRRSESNPLQIVSQLSSEVELASPATTPWRVIMVGDSPGELVENNDIILNLSEPCAIADTSWIKPGKVIRDITLSDAGAKSCIEFAVKHNLQYIEFDAGWYGHEYDEASDATTITVDPKRSPGTLALKEHVKAANEAGLGVILYINRRALEKQLDDVLPLYKSWGVKGVKYGFVQVGPQKWTRWLHDAIAQAADHQLMVDVHDEYRGTGFCRTYPNLMTVEGIGGDETSPTNEQTLFQFFTRMIAGAADNKICYFNDRVEKNQNHAAQLAKGMMMYDPWQFLFWYDSASPEYIAKRGADAQGVIHETPELEFWDHMPTVWDDSKVLSGRIGDHAVVARRSGEEWFVGALNSDAVKLKLPMSFLTSGQDYVAHVYSHDPSVDTRTHVRIDRRKVNASESLEIDLGKNSGQAIRFVPVK